MTSDVHSSSGDDSSPLDVGGSTATRSVHDTGALEADASGVAGSERLDVDMAGYNEAHGGEKA